MTRSELMEEYVVTWLGTFCEYVRASFA